MLHVLLRRFRFLSICIASLCLFNALVYFRIFTIPSLRQPPLCTSDTWQDGQWTKKGPRDLENLLAAPNFKSYLAAQGYHCPEPEYSCRVHPLDSLKAMASYEWVPKKCAMAPLQPDRVVSDMITSGGWFFVGESTTRQQVVSLACLLGEHLEKVQHPDVPSNDDANALQYVFSARSPLAASHPHAVGRPLLLFWWSIFLLSPQELDALINKMHQQKMPLDSKLEQSRFQWSSWKFNEAITLLLHEELYKVFVINTGAYWNTMQLGVRLDNEQLAALHRATIETIHNSLRRLPPSIDVFYRSSHYFNTHCASASGPSQLDLSLPTDGKWPQIVAMEPQWSEIDDPHYQLLNITGPTYKRPDAHANPPKDCLHFCQGTGVLENWSRLLWTLVSQHHKIR